MIENFLGRISRTLRCQSLSGDCDILVGERMSHLAEVSTLWVADLHGFRCFGNELGLLIINNNVCCMNRSPGDTLLCSRSSAGIPQGSIVASGHSTPNAGSAPAGCWGPVVHSVPGSERGHDEPGEPDRTAITSVSRRAFFRTGSGSGGTASSLRRRECAVEESTFSFRTSVPETQSSKNHATHPSIDKNHRSFSLGTSFLANPKRLCQEVGNPFGHVLAVALAPG